MAYVHKGKSGDDVASTSASTGPSLKPKRSFRSKPSLKFNPASIVSSKGSQFDPDEKWDLFVKRHVLIQSQVVSRTLVGRDMQEARELVLDYLDGYLLWLSSQSREHFKASFYASTTFIPGFQHSPAGGPLSTKDLLNFKSPTFIIPSTPDEARKRLESYLVLWKSLYTVIEAAAHSANRLAQLFDWEVTHDGPLFRLSRHCACTTLGKNPALYNDDTLYIDLKLDQIQLGLTQRDIEEFYHDGISEIKKRCINFDDLHESATFRIAEDPSRYHYPNDSITQTLAGTTAAADPTTAEIDPAPPASSSSKVTKIPHLNPGWTQKTFYEPEGVYSLIVAFRNQFNLIFFNVYLALVSWAWYFPDQTTLPTVLIIDGITASLQFLCEALARWSVYGCSGSFKRSLPVWCIVFQLFLYVVGLGEVAVWVVFRNKQSTMARNLMLAVVCGAVALRVIYHLLLFFKFPSIGKGHHKYRSRSKSQTLALFFKNYVFFFVSTAVLVPLYRWFVIPTLSRSAFWTFCVSPAIGPRIQCYIGVVGLWVPLLAVILISNFIAFTIALSLFGGWLAHVNRIEFSNDEGLDVSTSMAEFATTLRKWNKKTSPASETSEEITDKNPSIADDSHVVGDTAKVAATAKSAKSPKKGRRRRIPNASKRTDATTILDDVSGLRPVWYRIVDDLCDMDYYPKETKTQLYALFNWKEIPLGSRPRDVIQFFFSSLSAFVKSNFLKEIGDDYLDNLPGLTQLIPCYEEMIVFDLAYLCSTEKKPLSNLEFLVNKYPKEWVYFYARMKELFAESRMCFGTSAMKKQPAYYLFPPSPEDMMHSFLAYARLQSEPEKQAQIRFHPDVVNEIRLWASLRGQTLYRTLRGALAYRMALSALYEVTNRPAGLVATKYQLILAHQRYGDPQFLKKIAGDVRLLFKKLSRPNILGSDQAGDSPFELAFDWNPRTVSSINSEINELKKQTPAEIRRWQLDNLYTERDRTKAFANELRSLIAQRSGNCPIDDSAFPFGSILAGLPRPTRILGKCWLYHFKATASMEGEEVRTWMLFGVGTPALFGDPDEDTIGWLRFMMQNGREYDFLIGRGQNCRIEEITFTGTKTFDGEVRPYSYIKFTVRHLYDAKVTETFAIVGCLNETLDILPDGDPQYMYQSIDDLEAGRIREALTSSKPSVSCSGERSSEAYWDQNKQKSFTDFHAHLKKYAVPMGSEVPDPQDGPSIFLGIKVKHVLPRLNQLLLHTNGPHPFAKTDPIQGKAANQMNGLRFAFGLIIQTKDANQGGNFAEGVKFPFLLQKFHLHSCRNREDQIAHLEKWCEVHGKSGDPEFIKWKAATDTSTPNSSTTSPTDSSNLLELTTFSIDGTPSYHLTVENTECSQPDAVQRRQHEFIAPPVILGFRESILTQHHGAVARYQAYAEWTFVTIINRVLSRLNLRMHYGHPDFFLGSWVFSRSALSKASPVYNLSEDVFAGYIALLNERRSTHTDRIQDEKGRDVSLGTTATFHGKLAQGAASQLKSRDVFNMATRLDFVRHYLSFNAGLGYYFTTTAMLLSVKLYLLGLMSFSLAGFGAENLGNLQLVYSVPFLVQIGMFTLLPLLIETGFEKGFLAIVKIILDLPLSLGYFLFQSQTTAHFLIESFNKGRAAYAATGRLLGISRRSLTELYVSYGISHFEPALDYLFYIVAYYIVAQSRNAGFVPVFAPIICVVVFLIAPSGFQLATPPGVLFQDVGKFVTWVFATDDFKGIANEKQSMPIKENMIKMTKSDQQYKNVAEAKSLQIHTIFNAFDSVKNTHWRVDLGAAFFNFVSLLLWTFQVFSVPGGMKDSIIKIMISMVLLIMLNISKSLLSPPRGKHKVWRAISTILFALTLGYFLALIVVLEVWTYMGECIVGVFLGLKILKSGALVLFHICALFLKVHYDRKWKADKTSDKKTKDEKIGGELDTGLLYGLALVDAVDRPVATIGLVGVLVPVHTVFSLLWAIPLLSHYLMFSTRLTPKKPPKHYRPAANFRNGFNVDDPDASREFELPLYDH